MILFNSIFSYIFQTFFKYLKNKANDLKYFFIKASKYKDANEIKQSLVYCKKINRSKQGYYIVFLPFCIEPFKVIKLNKVDYITTLHLKDIKKGGFSTRYSIKELYKNLN